MISHDISLVNSIKFKIFLIIIIGGFDKTLVVIMNSFENKRAKLVIYSQN